MRTAAWVHQAMDWVRWGWIGIAALFLAACASTPPNPPPTSTVTLPPGGSLIAAHEGPEVYLYGGGLKMRIKNPRALERCGYSFTDVVWLSLTDLRAIHTGPELDAGTCLMEKKAVITGAREVPAGLIARASKPGEVYFAIPGEVKRPIVPPLTADAAVLVMKEAFGASIGAVRIVADRVFDDLPLASGALQTRDHVYNMIAFSRKFGLLINGDPQFTWGCQSEGFRLNADFCSKEVAKGQSDEWQAYRTNQLQRASMKALIDYNRTNVPIKGIIINGDLTRFGDKDEMLGQFKDYYRPEYFTVPVWMGLGNHDIGVPPVGDCGAAMTRNYCAAQMAQFMAQQLVDGAIPRVNYHVTTYDKNPAQSGEQRNVGGSLAYSWNIRDFHFVQLQNFPGYAVAFKRGYDSGISSWYIDLVSAAAWLRDDLDDYIGMRFILNWHRYSDLTDDEKQVVKNMLRPHRESIVAIFVGHIHNSVGQIDEIYYEDEPEHTRIPIINSGAPIDNRYIHAEFASDPQGCTLVTQVKRSINADGTAAVYDDADGWNGNTRLQYAIDGRYERSCTWPTRSTGGP